MWVWLQIDVLEVVRTVLMRRSNKMKTWGPVLLYMTGHHLSSFAAAASASALRWAGTVGWLADLALPCRDEDAITGAVT